MTPLKKCNPLGSIYSVKIFLTTLFFIILILSFLAEKTIYKGAGWDGGYYREVVRNFPDLLSASFSDYKASRILPFATAHFLLKVLHLEPTDEIILITVWAMIMLMMIAGVIYYYKITILLNWRTDLSLLGFVILFYNFAILKFTGFYPILTDHFIFPLTIIVIFHFLKKNYTYLMILGFAGCFIWPTYILIIPLLVLNNPIRFSEDETNLYKPTEKVWKLIKFGIALLPIALFIHLIRTHDLWIEKRYLTASNYENFRPFNQNIFIASVIALYSYYVALMWPISFRMIKSFLQSLLLTKKKQFILAVVFLLAVKIVKYFLTLGNTDYPWPTISTLLLEFTFRPAVAPFNFIIYAYWYLGFIVFFVTRYYSQVLQRFLLLGNGYSLLLVYSLIFLTTGQSRWLITMLPIFVIPLINVLHDTIVKPIASKQLLLLVGFSLLVSRFWYPFEGFWFTMKEDTLKEPGYWEKYPMFIGPWISNYHYVWLTAIGIVFYIVWNRYWLSKLMKKNN
jgi:hypothetical protein